MSRPVETEWIPSGGLRLHARLRLLGAGAPTVVLLCGLGLYTFEYDPLGELLADAGVGTVSFDYRGHGRSEGARGAWTLADLVDDARAALASLRRHEPGPLHLFGNSLGAMVAIAAAPAEPQVRSVIASNCPAHVGDFLLTRPRRALLAATRALPHGLGLRISVDHFYAYEHLISDPFWISRLRDDPLVADARRLRIPTYRSLIEDWDGPAAVRSLQVPLLVVHGSHDRLQPARQSELLVEAGIGPPGHVVLDTGHLPHLEDPDRTAQVVLEWLHEWGDQ